MSTKEFTKAATLLQRLVRLQAADDWGFASCVTCGQRDDYRNLHGGHYIPRSYKVHALDPANCWPQCYSCNVTLSGNLGRFTDFMLATYGPEFVDHLHATKRGPCRYTRGELLALIEDLKGQIKAEERRIGIRSGAA